MSNIAVVNAANVGVSPFVPQSPDIRALRAVSGEIGHDTKLLKAILELNDAASDQVTQTLVSHLGTVSGRTIGLLGLACAPAMDHVCEAPVLGLVRALLGAGATVRASCPGAIQHVARIVPDVTLASNAYAAAMGADAVVVTAEWPADQELDLDRLANAMRGRLLLDQHHLLDPATVDAADLIYRGVARSGPMPPASLANLRPMSAVRASR